MNSTIVFAPGAGTMEMLSMDKRMEAETETGRTAVGRPSSDLQRGQKAHDVSSGHAVRTSRLLIGRFQEQDLSDSAGMVDSKSFEDVEKGLREVDAATFSR